MTNNKTAAKLHNIGIDVEIHRIIESARQSFDEDATDILKRLLKADSGRVTIANMDKVDETRKANVEQARAREAAPIIDRTPGGRRREWQSEGVAVPHGTPARFVYQRGKQTIEGTFLNGDLVVDGKRYSTLSEAANSIARTRGGKQTRLNGWAYWQVRMPGTERWQTMADLRDGAKALKAKPTVRVKASTVEARAN